MKRLWRPVFLLPVILVGLFFYFQIEEKTKSNFLQGVRSDTFYTNLDRDIKAINPFALSGGYAGFEITRRVLDPLLYEDPDTGQYQPALAVNWEKNENGLTYTFNLRSDAVFHDGQPVTAEDVVFSIEAYKNPKYRTGNWSLFANTVETAKVLGKHSLSITFKDANVSSFKLVAFFMGVIPRHIYGDLGRYTDWRKILVGSGPYKLSGFAAGKKLVLARNPLWWGAQVDSTMHLQGKPRIHFRFVKDINAQIQMLRSGQLDYLRIYDPIDYFKFKDDLPKSVVADRTRFEVPGGSRILVINRRSTKLNDKRVRQALIMLFDREEANKKLFRGELKLGTGPWHQNNSSADSSVEPIPYDKAKALELLNEAGWVDSNGDGVLDKIIDGQIVSLEITILNYKPNLRKILVLFQQAARDLGVLIEIKHLDFAGWYKIYKEIGFEMTLIRSHWNKGSGEDLDPTLYMHSMYADQEHPSNVEGLHNETIDRLLEEFKSSRSKAEKRRKLRAIYRIAADEVAYYHLFDDKYAHYFVSTRVKRPKDTPRNTIGVEYWSL